MYIDLIGIHDVLRCSKDLISLFIKYYFFERTSNASFNDTSASSAHRQNRPLKVSYNQPSRQTSYTKSVQKRERFFPIAIGIDKVKASEYIITLFLSFVFSDLCLNLMNYNLEMYLKNKRDRSYINGHGRFELSSRLNVL